MKNHSIHSHLFLFIVFLHILLFHIDVPFIKGKYESLSFPKLTASHFHYDSRINPNSILLFLESIQFANHFLPHIKHNRIILSLKLFLLFIFLFMITFFSYFIFQFSLMSIPSIIEFEMIDD